MWYYSRCTIIRALMPECCFHWFCWMLDSIECAEAVERISAGVGGGEELVVVLSCCFVGTFFHVICTIYWDVIEKHQLHEVWAWPVDLAVATGTSNGCQPHTWKTFGGLSSCNSPIKNNFFFTFAQKCSSWWLSWKNFMPFLLDSSGWQWRLITRWDFRVLVTGCLSLSRSKNINLQSEFRLFLFRAIFCITHCDWSSSLSW